ncbi:MAG: hypothetical protein OXG60_18350 [Chloroflexi bacterium]|nr:hypothetical protein [Chloroflexota bacterium]
MGRHCGAVIFGVVALLMAWAMARLFANGPNYTDSFYHLNAANSLYAGDGLVDHYLWTYVDAPESLPAPSHRYWMPLTSVLAAIGMALLAAPDSFQAAQFLFVLATAGAGLVAYLLALLLGGGRRQAWVAGLLTVMGGYFAPRWGAIDTFAPYALVGSLCLLLIGMSAKSKGNRVLYAALSGLFAGLCHLTRPDGVLMLFTALLVSLWGPAMRSRGRSAAAKRLAALTQNRKPSRRTSDAAYVDRGWNRGVYAALILTCYILTMFPWFLGNLNATGAVLPEGGLRAIWFQEYDDLFNYPNDASPRNFFADGLETLARTRAIGIANGLGTFVAVEGGIVLAPFMLIGLWRRRRNPLLGGFWFYAIGIHLLMCLLFPLPGYRGGLFHAVSALFPFWMALGVLGLDDAINWIGKRSESWNRGHTKPLYSMTVLIVGASLSLVIADRAGIDQEPPLPAAYAAIHSVLPADARVMINDPARLYYQLGMTGVSLPNESIDVAFEIAAKYDVGYILMENVTDDGFARAAPRKLQFDLDDPPRFLRQILLEDLPHAGLYEFLHDSPKAS